MRFKLDRSSYRVGREPINYTKAIPVGKTPEYEWESQEYEIEINTFEELMELIEEVGKIIVDKDEIVIYDYYME